MQSSDLFIYVHNDGIFIPINAPFMYDNRISGGGAAKIVGGKIDLVVMLSINKLFYAGWQIGATHFIQPTKEAIYGMNHFSQAIP